MRRDCWECRRKWPIRRLAPRLAAAYDLQLEVDREKRRRKLAALAVATSRLLEERRVLEHRELQFIRAGRIPNGRKDARPYAKERVKKLIQARERVARAEARVERIRASL